MCENCGCTGHNDPHPTSPRLREYLHAHVDPLGNIYYHSHNNNLTEHTHHDASSPNETIKVINVNSSILAYNNRLAAQIRTELEKRNIFAINLMSAPGSGKTTLLEKTIELLHPKLYCAVIVGDLATDRDAARIKKSGAPVVQITTGTACHLDAHMIMAALEKLPLDLIRVLFIENVGNLVCPAAFDLGEKLKVVLLSTTEGEDKPLKYPPIFAGAHAVIITKVDLAPLVDFDIQAARSNIATVVPKAKVITLSAKTGEGMHDWISYLQNAINA